MKRKSIKVLLLAGALIISMIMAGGSALSSYAADTNWKVTVNKSGKIVSNFKSSQISETVNGMQPGDKVTFKVTLSNAYSKSAKMYMENNVLYSLEDRSRNKATAGGAYTYKLTYTDSSGKTEEFFNSDTVGGDNVSEAGEGLHEATDSLKDWFLLEELGTGKSGVVELTVMLDGETQGNNYQDTLADLEMRFATEFPTKTTKVVKRTGAKTGDSQKWILWLVIAAVAGVALLVYALKSIKGRKAEAVPKAGINNTDSPDPGGESASQEDGREDVR